MFNKIKELFHVKKNPYKIFFVFLVISYSIIFTILEVDGTFIFHPFFKFKSESDPLYNITKNFYY